METTLQPSAPPATVLPDVHGGATVVPPSAVPDERARVTTAVVARMFPETPVAHIVANLPAVLSALGTAGLTDSPMLLAALGTIRAETEGFEPICEEPSALNTSPGGQPFDLYDHRADLGNQGPPDGARYCGRGFVQLTGRANYARYARLTGLDLVAHPELACEAGPAATLLARFLADRQDRIRHALVAGDLTQARRLVNGGSNGLARFSSAVQIGSTLLA